MKVLDPIQSLSMKRTFDDAFPDPDSPERDVNEVEDTQYARVYMRDYVGMMNRNTFELALQYYKHEVFILVSPLGDEMFLSKQTASDMGRKVLGMINNSVMDDIQLMNIYNVMRGSM